MATADARQGAFKPRNLIALSDGTGNSAAKLFRTNVWRIYEALDLNCDDQVALYDNGVGTASFKPLAAIGGAFGYGLKRNVLDLYVFLCRNYQCAADYHYDPENPAADDPASHDKIFAFGFSRGAFTARVVASLVANEGLIHRAETDAELNRLAKWAYRSYRAKRYGHRNKLQTAIVGSLRWLRDRLLRVREFRKPVYDPLKNRRVPVDFLGVFDTVAAYGLPMDELTQGWDRWVWPLTPRDNSLHPGVKSARHAVAMDDERQTFFPLLWDEDSEEAKKRDRRLGLPPDRIKQVWFAGMHSNVGGGYADDALSLGPLCWIAGDAVTHGLRFQPHMCPSRKGIPDVWLERAAPCAPMGDSRQGASAYYRYCPRPIRRLCGMDDTASPRRVKIERPKIHASVFERIRDSRDNYAPLALPDRYDVVGRDGSVLAGDADAVPPAANPNPFEHSTQAASRVREQQKTWDAVWKRRVVYFSTIIATLVLLALPSLPLPQLPASHTARKALSSLGGFLPDFAEGWLNAYSDRPLWFFIIAGFVGLFLWNGKKLKRTVNDTMGTVWGSQDRHGVHATKLDALAPPHNSLIYRLRESAAYKFGFRVLTDKLAPNVFGIGLLVIILLLLAAIPVRLTYQFASRRESFCKPNHAVAGDLLTPDGAVGGAPRSAEFWFHPADICRKAGVNLKAGQRYAIQVAIPADPLVNTEGPPVIDESRSCRAETPDPNLQRSVGGWKDLTIPVTSTAGIGSTWKMRLFVPFRRVWAASWFVPIAAVGIAWPERYYLTEPAMSFTPNRDGPLSIYVNDAAFPLGRVNGEWCTGWDCYYRNNIGGPAKVRVTELSGSMTESSLPALEPYDCDAQKKKGPG